MRPLLLATANAGKIRELSALLPGIRVTSLRERASGLVLDEPGEDYVTNAVAKARAASAATGDVALADDSGIEVDSLGGAPGWRSARFAGAHGDDAGNRAVLLTAMNGVARRRARFRCVVAVADVRGPLGDRVLLGFGDCVGQIAQAARGAGGFGYDPILLVGDGDRTMAELSDDAKNNVSHRGRAVGAVLPALREYLRRAWGEETAAER